MKEGSFTYIIGKGRNRKPGFPELNQNYALRLKGEKGEARVSFLFASEPSKDKLAEWHRWTTTKGFASAGWHQFRPAGALLDPRFGEGTTRRPAAGPDH